jgi:hypothetical protein
MRTYDPRNSYPTQNDLVLSHLKREGSITQGQALKFGCSRLASRIHELKKRGHDIKSETMTVRTMSGEARIARYVHG